MDPSASTTVTRLLQEIQQGNRAVLGELFALVYEELHQRAHRQRARWQGDYTLNTTALVHEAYLKLVAQPDPDWQGRAHFLAVAAKAMRHILIDYAKRRRTQKRGDDVQKLSLDEMKLGTDQIAFTEEQVDKLLLLEQALERLEQERPREAQVVVCRFYGKMQVEETATALGISPRTVKRDWVMAQVWLRREMQKEMER